MDAESRQARAPIHGGIEKTIVKHERLKWDISSASDLTHLEHDFLIVIQLVSSHGRSRLQDGRHVVEPLLSLFGLIPVH